MQNEILAELDRLEAAQNLKILLAVESGSRAWGFPSPDSDYDVRVIYCREPAWYLSVEKRKDNFDYFKNELLDINGWDLRKALSLLRKSNATPFEWAQSPIVYREVPGFKEELLALAQAFFAPRSSLGHYKGITLKSYSTTTLEGDIKLKKLFYVLRPLLAARWVMEYASLPPMAMEPLLAMVKDENIVEEIRRLIQLKTGVGEGYTYRLDDDITTFIDQELSIVQAADLPHTTARGVDTLNQFFHKTIGFSSS